MPGPTKHRVPPWGNSVGWRVGEGQEGAALDVSFAKMTLERLGWRFIRVSDSEYLRHPDVTMRNIQKRLKKFKVQPMGLLEARANGKSNDKGGGEDLQSGDLHKQLLRRVEFIRSRCQDIPSVSSIFKQG